MHTPRDTADVPPPAASAWSALERALVRRRWRAIEPVLRVELALIALLLAGFLFLQVRGPFEDLAARAGAGTLAAVLALVAFACAAVATGITAARHARRLRRPEGPAWFALPIDSDAIERHLAWASRAQAAWLLLPALAAFAAAVGLVPLPALAGLAAMQVALLLAGSRLGCALARRRVGPPVPGDASAAARPRMPAARFRRVAPWAAIVLKDASVAARRAELRQGAAGVAVFTAVSLLGWLLPTAPAAPGAVGAPAAGFDLRHLATFFVTLLGAAALAEWMVILVGSDPFAVFRVLPLDVRAVWRARFTWIVLVAGACVTGHALLARGLALPARLLFLAWVAAATVGIALVGLHLALLLYPRTGPARPLLALTFGVMAIASIAVFLSGWLVLVAAIVLTALRLPRWGQAAEDSA